MSFSRGNVSAERGRRITMLRRTSLSGSSCKTAEIGRPLARSPRGGVATSASPRAKAAAQVGINDAHYPVDFVIRHFGLAETIDDDGALKRIDARSRGIAARLGLLDEARSRAASRFNASRMTCLALGRIWNVRRRPSLS